MHDLRLPALYFLLVGAHLGHEFGLALALELELVDLGASASVRAARERSSLLVHVVWQRGEDAAEAERAHNLVDLVELHVEAAECGLALLCECIQGSLSASEWA